MLKRLLFILILPMLLLSAQQQMFAHEISHINQTQQSSKHHPAPNEFCAQCSHFTGVSTGLVTDLITVESIPYLHVITFATSFVAYQYNARFFSARAPPTVL